MTIEPWLLTSDSVTRTPVVLLPGALYHDRQGRVWVYLGCGPLPHAGQDVVCLRRERALPGEPLRLETLTAFVEGYTPPDVAAAAPTAERIMGRHDSGSGV